MFKPPLKIRDRKGLLKLLRQYDKKGLGGILFDDVQESLPNHEKVLKVRKKAQFVIRVKLTHRFLSILAIGERHCLCSPTHR